MGRNGGKKKKVEIDGEKGEKEETKKGITAQEHGN